MNMLEKAEKEIMQKEFGSDAEKKLAYLTIKQAKLDGTFSLMFIEIGKTFDIFTDFNEKVAEFLGKLIDEKGISIDVSSLKKELEGMKKHKPNLEWLARRLKEEGKTSSK